jgi:hypothetical protein
MKIRKRMGFPKARSLALRGMRDTARQSVADVLTDRPRIRPRKALVREMQQLAAMQRELDELLSADTALASADAPRATQPSERAASTPEKLVAHLDRMAAMTAKG